MALYYILLLDFPLAPRTCWPHALSLWPCPHLLRLAIEICGVVAHVLRFYYCPNERPKQYVLGDFPLNHHLAKFFFVGVG